MKYYFNRDKSTGILEKIDVATGKVIETFGDDYSSAMVHEGRDMVRVGGELKSVSELTVNRNFGYEYSELMAGAIVAFMMEGEPLTRVLKRPGMPSMMVVMKWASQVEEFREAMDHASRAQAYGYIEKVDDISHSLAAGGLSKNDVESMKSGMDGFKWLAEKSDPVKFGAKKDVGNSSGITVVIHTGVPDREPIVEASFTEVHDA